jgi:hypothetical protein
MTIMLRQSCDIMRESNLFRVTCWTWDAPYIKYSLLAVMVIDYVGRSSRLLVEFKVLFWEVIGEVNQRFGTGLKYGDSASLDVS